MRTTFDEGTLSGTSINSPTRQQDWTLDQLGNWPGFVVKAGGSTTLNQARYHNSVNEIDVDDDHSNTPGASITASAGTNWYDPKYDAAGNMTTMPRPEDPTLSFVLTYDAWNRLMSVDNGFDYYRAQYEYDGLGRRIVHSAYDVSGALSDRFHCYYNEDWQLLEERHEVDGVEEYDSFRNEYLWHPYYIDALALRYSTFGAHYHLHDGNFNVTAVTDNSGSVVERYAYTPYGEVTFLEPDFDVAATQASTIENTHLYTGRERDPETGLQLNRHRFYSAILGRWMTRDPIGYDGSDWNLYGYLSGSPCSFTDPSGKFRGPCHDLGDGEVCISSNCTQSFWVIPEIGPRRLVKPGECIPADGVDVKYEFVRVKVPPNQEGCEHTFEFCNNCGTFKVVGGCSVTVDCKSCGPGGAVGKPTCKGFWSNFCQTFGGGCGKYFPGR